MKKILSIFAASLICIAVSTSCIKEIDPQGSTITADQAQEANGSFANFVSTITSTLVGEFVYYGSSSYPFDYGYPSFFIWRDIMGMDLTANSSTWYYAPMMYFTYLGPTYAYCQFPWTCYYTWIKNCNTVLAMVGDNPEEGEETEGAGIAYCIRAMMYMDLARMFAQRTPIEDSTAETVPIITQNTTVVESTTNARATNEVMWDFIISDLDLAETYLADYVRDDVFTPDVSVVYGLKARAYLQMGEWQNAYDYAQKAQEGYTPTTNDEWTSWTDGFNTPTSGWMFGVNHKSTDPALQDNDADTSWGAQMIIEVGPSECGYAANYGDPKYIDRHLYETIPDTDIRKSVFIDFAIDDMDLIDENGDQNPDAVEFLSAYSEQPEYLIVTAEATDRYTAGGMELKFRPAGGEHDNQYLAFLVSVPLMRVEEMMLIEAEAAYRKGSTSEAISTLNELGQLRDPSYDASSYVHNEAYGNSSTDAFVNEVWWQRRVELWGEGFATFDIKRLDKGVIRNYTDTNWEEGIRWNYGYYDVNQGIYPNWMDWCIVQTETNYNESCTNNPTAEQPDEDSPEFTSFD